MYTLIGTIVDSTGKIKGVKLFNEGTRQVIEGDYEGFISTGASRLALRNFDKEKMEPFDGWDNYSKYDETGTLTTSSTWVLLNATSTGQYLIVDGSGDLRSVPHYIALLEFAEQNNLRNWYGYSVRNGRPYAYQEERESDDIGLGCPSSIKVKAPVKRQRKEVSKLPREKGEAYEFEDGTAQATFKSSGMGDEERVKAWTEQYIGTISHVSDEAKERVLADYHSKVTANSKLSALFSSTDYTWCSNKKSTVLIAFPFDTDKGTRYGLCLEYRKDTKAAVWVVAPPVYEYIAVAYAGSTPVAICMREDQTLEILNLRTSNTVTGFNGKSIKDYICIARGSDTFTGQLLVGCDTGSENLYYWYSLGKDLQVVKDITCKMGVSGQAFKDRRTYFGALQIAEFTDRDGMTVVLNLKDYSYDSRITFSRGNIGKQVNEETDKVPEWADVVLDFTAGTIRTKDSLGDEKLVKIFINLTPDILNIMGKWLDSTATIPVEKEVGVRRHTEKHKLSTFNRVDYDKVLAVMEVLGKFEKYSDISVLLNYCSFNGITTATQLMEEFDIDKSFHLLTECSDNNKLYTKATVICLNQAIGTNNTAATFGMLQMFFWRRGAGIQTISNTIFKGGMSADLSKVSLSEDNLRGLIDLALSQTKTAQVYQLVPTAVKVLKTVEGAGLKAPRYVTESYSKAHTTVHDANSDLKLLITNWKVLDNEIEKLNTTLFFGLYDGLSFRTSKDELPPKDEEELTTAERAKIYSTVLNPDKPLLTSKMPAVFKVALS